MWKQPVPEIGVSTSCLLRIESPIRIRPFRTPYGYYFNLKHSKSRYLFSTVIVERLKRAEISTYFSGPV